MKKLLLVMSLIVMIRNISAQKKTTSSAVVKFDATTPKDALPKAENKTVVGSLDTKTGAVQFEAAVNNFAFTNPMIQEHFNGDKWMNSAVYPKFTFSGKVEDITKLKSKKDGTYTTNVSGALTIRDKTKNIKAPVKFVVKGGKITATSSFKIKLTDYNITGVPIEAGKVAKDPKISITASF